MAVKITSTGRTTFVKEIKIGAPITSVKETQGIFLTTGKSQGHILIYDSAEGFYRSGPLVGGSGVTVTHSTDSDSLTLAVNISDFSTDSYLKVLLIYTILMIEPDRH